MKTDKNHVSTPHKLEKFEDQVLHPEHVNKVKLDIKHGKNGSPGNDFKNKSRVGSNSKGGARSSQRQGRERKAGRKYVGLVTRTVVRCCLFRLCSRDAQNWQLECLDPLNALKLRQ